MSENPLVFVSHSSKDAARANELIAELERRGITCWIAPRNIAAGTEYDDAIIQALNKCDALVVLISEASISSRHVRSEVSRAASDGKRILPIRLVDVEIQGGLKFFLELSQYVDLFGHPTPDIIDSVAAALKGTGGPANITALPVKRRSAGSRKMLYTAAAAAAFFGVIFVGYLYSSMQQAAREEEAMLLQSMVDSLQVFPYFELRDRDVVLASWSLNGDASSNWKGVTAHWLINDTEKVPFDYAMPRELTLAKAAGFSTLALVLDVPGVESPVTKDFSFDVRKLISDQTKAMSESFSMMPAFFKCGKGGCYFQYELLGVCSAAVSSLSISPVFADGKTQPEPLDIPLDFCDQVRKDSLNWAMENVCLPDTVERMIDQSQKPELTVTLIDGTQASLSAMKGDLVGMDYPPICFATL